MILIYFFSDYLRKKKKASYLLTEIKRKFFEKDKYYDNDDTMSVMSVMSTMSSISSVSRSSAGVHSLKSSVSQYSLERFTEHVVLGTPNDSLLQNHNGQQLKCKSFQKIFPIVIYILIQFLSLQSSSFRVRQQMPSDFGQLNTASNRKNDLILMMTPEKQDKTSELIKHWSPDSTPTRNRVIMKTTHPVNQ